VRANTEQETQTKGEAKIGESVSMLRTVMCTDLREVGDVTPEPCHQRLVLPLELGQLEARQHRALVPLVRQRSPVLTVVGHRLHPAQPVRTVRAPCLALECGSDLALHAHHRHCHLLRRLGLLQLLQTARKAVLVV
jgi:hypothetical protein